MLDKVPSSRQFFTFTEDAWSRIYKEIEDVKSAEAIRARIEAACDSFLQSSETENSIEFTATAERWKQILSTSEKLSLLLEGLTTPVLPENNRLATDAPLKRQLIEPANDASPLSQFVVHLETFSRWAVGNAFLYSFESGLRAQNRQPAREELYEEILRIWTDEIGRPLNTARSGPLWRYFNACTAPVLGTDALQPEGFRSLAKREIARRRGRVV